MFVYFALLPLPHIPKNTKLRVKLKKTNSPPAFFKEKLIHLTHNEAVKNQHFTYDDPQTGLKVITRLKTFSEGVMLW